uniref:DUF1664 domain-containing protein n=1 Tax=Chenopodium quinoa TaxID=63459 RepID=A0A803L1A9_CHEQI
MINSSPSMMVGWNGDFSRGFIVGGGLAPGGRKYGVIIVIVAVGYGYVWWKGWKIPDFMFATKRGLSDACNAVAKQLDEVFLSLRASSSLPATHLMYWATRNEIASKLDQSSNKFEDIIACSNSTKEEVAAVSGEVSNFVADLQEVNDTIRTLDETKDGVAKLLLSTLEMENMFTDLIQDSPSAASRAAIEHQVATPSRSVSLPLTLEPSSPSTSCGSNEANGDPSNASSTSGLTECQKNSGAVKNNASPRVSPRCNITEITEKPSSPELPATQPNVKSAGLLSRTISATRNFRFM